MLILVCLNLNVYNYNINNIVINMSNASKRKVSVSKHHVRRIIQDETNIDIAGLSTQIIKQSLFNTNRSLKDNCLVLHKNSDINIHAFNKDI